MKKKAIWMVLAAVVLVVASVGGTIAYLTSTPAALTNTFTVGKVAETLTEPTWSGDGADHQLVPGKVLTKDPKVTVLAGSEKAYVFIKVTATADVKAVLTYSVDTTVWTSYSGDVYYRVVDKSTSDTVLSVLTSNQITVKTTAVAAELNALTSGSILKVSSAAVQFDNVKGTAPQTDLDAAYAIISGNL